jgi:hypothetical protein
VLDQPLAVLREDGGHPHHIIHCKSMNQRNGDGRTFPSLIVDVGCPIAGPPLTSLNPTNSMCLM